ncbi:MAG: alkaline phosphatase family protein [Chloroflexi bacterium]|nr:alkaline phosphatase family protein [Chloroflexota bacterium]
MNIAAQTEHAIRQHRLSDLEGHLPEEFILPNYDGYSITNLAPTIARLLGVELVDAAPPLPANLWTDMAPGVQRVVMVILDAVGYLHLQRVLAESKKDSTFYRLAQAGRLVPLTSVFPSTTVAALTTLWTGRTPLDHGFLGTKLLLGKQGLLANMLTLGPAIHRKPGELSKWGWDPEEFVTVPSLGQQLTNNGIRAIAHTHLPFIGGDLTRIFLRGMENIRGHVDFSDMWINLRRALSQRPSSNTPLFVSGYWGGIDNTAHVYGPEGEPFQAAIRHLDRSLKEDFLAALPTAAREGTLLIITADHGQTTTPPEQIVHLSDHPDLQRMLLIPPAAETRAAYLYVRPGQTESLRAYIAEHLNNRFLLLETEHVLNAGLFGPLNGTEPPPEIRARLGDMLLLAQDNSRLLFTKDPVPFHGHHGSLMAEEMLVPLLMVRLDAL